ncbi:hypothetical protein JCM11754A_21520 [Isoptericola variabilis]
MMAQTHHPCVAGATPAAQTLPGFSPRRPRGVRPCTPSTPTTWTRPGRRGQPVVQVAPFTLTLAGADVSPVWDAL